MTSVASIGADGKTPEPVFDPGVYQPQIPSFLATNGDGSAVAYALPATSGTSAGAEYVHNFTSGVTWQIGTGTVGGALYGLSDSGSIVAYGSAGIGSIWHLYRQAQGSAPKEVDTCTSITQTACGAEASMSADVGVVSVARIHFGVQGEEQAGAFRRARP